MFALGCRCSLQLKQYSVVSFLGDVKKKNFAFCMTIVPLKSVVNVRWFTAALVGHTPRWHCTALQALGSLGNTWL